jgi:Erv1 / Alr family
MSDILDYETLNKIFHGVSSEYKGFEDPSYYGPGIWLLIHQLAYEANTVDLQKEAAEKIKNIITNFRCKICREHGKEYLALFEIKDSIGKYMKRHGKNQMLGLFVWTWMFHNHVNGRIGKKQMRLDDALKPFEIDQNEGLGYCTATCGSSK